MDYRQMKIAGVEATDTACTSEPQTVYSEYTKLQEAAVKLKTLLADLERVVCGGSEPAEDHGFGEGFPGALNNARQDIETAMASAHRIWVTFGMEKEVGNATIL